MHFTLKMSGVMAIIRERSNRTDFTASTSDRLQFLLHERKGTQLLSYGLRHAKTCLRAYDGSDGPDQPVYSV